MLESDQVFWKEWSNSPNGGNVRKYGVMLEKWEEI